MKKIALCFTALAAVVSASGCLSNSAQACIAAATCAGEDDPAAFCEDAQADCDDDENCSKIQEACAAESDAAAACTVANGTCEDEVFTVEGCDDEFEASGECATDALAE